jgi:hypothetical protein
MPTATQHDKVQTPHDAVPSLHALQSTETQHDNVQPDRDAPEDAPPREVIGQ